MSKIHSTTLGYYNPAFFHLNISTNISFHEFSDKDYSVFVHEYIHFLQDVTTYYGLNNMFVYSEYLRFATNKIYKSINPHFKVPIIPFSDNEQNVFLNKQISKLTNGDSYEIKTIKSIDSIDIVKEETGVSGTKFDEIDSAIITCKNEKEEEFILIFGAICIKENMAYLMEQFICEKYEKSPDFPYSIAEKVAENIYPEFAYNKLNILALCDVSLQYSNPGPVFIHFLKEYKSLVWLPSKPEDIYDNAFDRPNILNEVSLTLIESSYNKLAITVKKQLTGYFNDPEIFSNLIIWLDELIETAKELRFINKYFILNMARNGKHEFDNIFKKIGTPLISNDIGECTLLYPSKPEEGVEIGYFYAIGQIIDLFESGNPECKMKKICKTQKNETDSRCNNEPWARCFDEIKCPYALLWNHWKLSSYVPFL